MKVARMLPYRQASSGCFKKERWEMDIVGKRTARKLKDEFPDWDPATPVRLLRQVRVDLNRVREECGLPQGTSLTLGCFWRCNGTTLRGYGTRAETAADGLFRKELRIDVPGEHLSGDLVLRVALVLTHNIKRIPLTAYRRGSVLWEVEDEVALEGGGARFPMEVRSFSKESWRFPDHAAWYLDLETTSWELPVTSGMRLYLNEEHPQVKLLLTEPNSPVSQLFNQTLFFDVGRQLLRGALMSEEFLHYEGRWRKGSLGDVIAKLLRLRFKNERPETLAHALKKDPAAFDSRLQHALDAWWSDKT